MLRMQPQKAKKYKKEMHVEAKMTRTGLWRLILCISLTELRDAQTAGKTSFLGVSVRLFWEEISIWMVDWVNQAALPECVSITHSTQAQTRTRNGRKAEFLLSLFELGHLLLLPLGIGASGSWTFRLGLNYTRSFPGSLWQSLRLLSPCNHVSQFP